MTALTMFEINSYITYFFGPRKTRYIKALKKEYCILNKKFCSRQRFALFVQYILYLEYTLYMTSFVRDEVNSQT